MGTSDDIGQAIFAYRSFDLRDRFPQPLETFREALACLQSDDAYMAAMSGEIIAYLRGGGTVQIPDDFFIHRSVNSVALLGEEENDAICLAVEAWLLERLAQINADFSQPETSRIRPYKLELLLDQCDANADETDEVHAWRDLTEVGREQLDECAAPKRPI
ncbi:hypothetical protein AAG584_21275 [Vreelandella titanicae]|uniref:hypothetical protein n=1 Tax=Vreelandella titanicae TaxID=664683 RepID=UPI001680E245|nr:hypothetical protein [Halomonas titanicae]QNU63187.1 hypothetical protein HZS52_02090 [Halomonas titanicae]